MKYRIIGDVHGRKVWKELVSMDSDVTNVFVGDYFDPYESITFDDLRANFLEIIDFAEKYKNTILLLGNHDLHYWWGTGRSSTSRFNKARASEIHELFMEAKDMFSLAYSIEDMYLVTHAGVTKNWQQVWLPDVELRPNTLAEAINNLKETPDAFDFEHNCDLFDVYGNSPQQSCVWVRPQTLFKHSVFEGTPYKQVVGHTQLTMVAGVATEDSEVNNLFLVDCLQIDRSCLQIGEDLLADIYRPESKENES